jgi:hypothetical protein
LLLAQQSVDARFRHDVLSGHAQKGKRNMILRGLAALVGATAILSLAVAPGFAATAQNAATHHPHRVATAAHARAQEKTSQPAVNTATNRITIVSVGPQAMYVRRYRDLAMEETG